MSAYRTEGDIVTIYEDPVTEQRPEGQAILISYEGTIGALDDDREIEMWVVEFERDPGQTFERQILTPA